MLHQAQEHKLSFMSALLINLNIMFGVGIFINTVKLAQHAGMLGGFTYTLVGILMLPLILSIATLVNLHPSGGFYTFAQKEINTFAGFISTWAYFTAKLASSTIMIHSAVMFLQTLIPAFGIVHPFVLDIIIIFLFLALNMLNIEAGSSIQTMFLICKTIPIIFIILTGIFLFQGNYATPPHILWSGIPTSLPLVIYAFLGFEAACSISSKIKNADINAPRVILLSYAIVALGTTLFQLAFYGVLGSTLAHLADYREAFPNFLQVLFPHNAWLAQKMSGIIHLGIVASALGGSYGIIFSNSWNLYVLAQNNHIAFSSFFTKLNKHFIPFACILVEGALCVMYLLVTQGKQDPLQQLSALGGVLAYTISVIALLRAKKKRPEIAIHRWIPALGLGSCIILLGACIRAFFITGLYALYAFMVLLMFGLAMYYRAQRKNQPSHNCCCK